MNRYSIITNDMSKCYVCGTTNNIHIHEVVYGSGKRQLSIKYGLCIGLCGYHHNLSNEGVHFNKALDTLLKQTAQMKFVEVYPDLDFIKVFGKSYL